MPQLQTALDWRGRDLVDRDGNKVGGIQEIYLDRDTEQPEWALVNTGLFGTRSTFVPLTDATEAEDAIKVPFEKSQIKDAPNVDADQELSQDEEASLYRHYGFDYSERRSDSGLPEGKGDGGRGAVGRDTSGPTTDDAMTRSEEEVRVGTASQETGRVRLRKYVVTENVTQTVPVQREEVRVEREPITDANVDAATSGPEISSEEHEVTLREEVPVVEKRTVPKERVRLDKDTIVEEREVSEDVRKEQIEVEGDR
jgi:uncharacterized protein (TIGR02271 family)